jgi:DNA invertase Pin-like site-specific DNA recombinase
VVQKERETIRQRQAEGIAAAKERGVHFGRIPAVLPDNFEAVLKMWKAKNLTDCAEWSALYSDI